MESKFDKSCVSRMLSTLRHNRNVTQAAIADEIGISDKTYSRWETGEALPDMESLAALADYFDVSPLVFFDANTHGSIGETIYRMYDGLTPTEQAERSFEIMFHTIRGVSQNAFDESWFSNYRNDFMDVAPPERRVFPGHNAKTDISFDDIYAMMYNGTDANIALSIMPHEDRYAWLTDSDEREHLSSLLTLLGDRDMLTMLPYIMSKDFSIQYTSEYIARCAGIDATHAEELLSESCRLGICSAQKTYIGDAEVMVYSADAEHMLTGILTLGYLIVNREKIDGCVAINAPGKITLGKVK